jgi:hypothetical protein
LQLKNLYYLQQSWNYQWSQEICDIIISGFQGEGVAICYKSEQLIALKTV